MNRLAAALQLAASHLSGRNRRFALVGGLAVSARTEPRFTRDVDLAVAAVDDSDAESLVHGLAALGYRILATVEQEGKGRLAAVRLLSPGEKETGVVVDLLFASSGIEPDVVKGAEPLEVFPGVEVPVARLGHLLALKALSADTRRPQDAVDIEALLREANAEDRRLAQEAATSIDDRGFGRGKNVRAELDRLVAAR